MIASTPAAASVADLCRVVDGPHVDLQTELVREGDRVEVGEGRRRRRDAARRGRARGARPPRRAGRAGARGTRCGARAHRSRTASIVPRSNEETTTSRIPLPDEVDCGPNDDVLGIGVGFPRQALHLDVDEHARARFERLRERRDRGLRGADRRRTAGPPTGPSGSAITSWWTTRTPSALRRTSSSTPSAPSARARANAARVFSGA